jgi:tetratricopeptide (TPR) repeat protein
MQLTHLKKPIVKWQVSSILLLSLLSGAALLTTPVGKRLVAKPKPLYDYPFALSLESDNQQTVESAISLYQGRVQQRPADGLDRAALAEAYLKMARVTGAENWYLLAEQEAQQSLVNLPFDNDGAVMVLAEIAQARHEFAEAVRLADQVSGAKSLTVVVTSKLAMGELAAAETAAEALVNFVPSLGSLSFRGLVRTAQGNQAGALSDFQRAIAAEEPGEERGSAQVRTFLGRLYAQQGKSEQAKKLYRESLEIVPDYPLALQHLAQLETRSGRYRAAHRQYSRLGEWTSSQGVSFQGIARVKTLQGRAADIEWESAETALRSHIDQNALGHRRDLAHLLLERGRDQDVSEAITLMQTEAQNRRDADTLDLLAWALLRGGQAQAAIATIREALGQGVQDPGIFYRAADIETALNNSEQAEEYIRLAQAIDPTFDQQTRIRLGLITQMVTQQ